MKRETRYCDVCGEEYTLSEALLEIETSDSRFVVEISAEDRISVRGRVDLCNRDRLRVLEAAGVTDEAAARPW